MAIIVGIDPDTEKSGYAVLDRKNHKLLVVSAVPFSAIIDFLYQADPEDTTIAIEAGWLNQSNWHLGRSDSKAIAAAKGRAVGRNQQVGHCIEELARAKGFNVITLSPLTKRWRGKDHKITAEEFKELTGWTARTNQDGRDAALIAIAAAEQLQRFSRHDRTDI